MEGEIAMAALLERFPQIRLADGQPNGVRTFCSGVWGQCPYGYKKTSIEDERLSEGMLKLNGNLLKLMSSKIEDDYVTGGHVLKLDVGMLEGERVQLVPLKREHTEDLYRAIDSHEIWTYLPSRMEKFEDMVSHVEEALESWELGNEVPFVVIDKESNKIVGMTRFEEVSLQNRRAEIGWTWYSKKVWRTQVNTEAKYLLLRHCFDFLNLVRVQFRVDIRNLRSREAVLRIGAKQEGILRKCGILYNGYIRDLVHYSIVDDEWSVVKKRIMGLLSVSP